MRALTETGPRHRHPQHSAVGPLRADLRQQRPAVALLAPGGLRIRTAPPGASRRVGVNALRPPPRGGHGFPEAHVIDEESRAQKHHRLCARGTAGPQSLCFVSLAPASCLLNLLRCWDRQLPHARCFYPFLIPSLQQPCEVGSLIFILQRGRLRSRGTK